MNEINNTIKSINSRFDQAESVSSKTSRLKLSNKRKKRNEKS